MFCVSVKPWLPTGAPVWVPFSWTQRMLEVIWNFSKGTGLPCLGHQIKRHKGAVQKAYADHPEIAQNHLL